MKKKTNRLLSVLLALLMATAFLPAFTAFAEDAPAVAATGYCGGEGDGTNLTWTLTDDGTLTVSGAGEMADYSGAECAPWYDHRENVKRFVVEDGVTYIPCNPVAYCSNLTAIEAAPGNSAYHATGNCLIETETKALISGCLASSIPRNGTVTSIKKRAFCGADKLKWIGITGHITEIGPEAFGSCGGLRNVYYESSEERWNQIDIDNTNGANNDLLNAAVRFNVFDWGFTGANGNEFNVFFVFVGNGTLTITGEGAMTTRWDTSKPNRYRSVVIENGVTNIPNYGFWDCMYLTSVTIPNSVTSIGGAAFVGCNALASVLIPNSVTEIHSHAFAPETVIYGCLGSAAQSYAAEYGNPFVAVCPTDAAHPLTAFEETPATDTEHGFTAGIYCSDCGVWLPGHEVIHNHLGEQFVIKPATETEEGLVDIVCTVCGERIRYTASTTGPEESEEDEEPGGFIGFWIRIQNLFRGIIDWFLRLFRRP